MTNITSSSAHTSLATNIHKSVKINNIEAVIKLNDTNIPITLEQTIFPTGEINVTASFMGSVNHSDMPLRGYNNIRFWRSELHIYALLKSSDDIITLGLVKSAIDELIHSYSIDTVMLFTPYLPYARQDKIHHTGEAMSFKVFANILNTYKIDKVITYDTHNLEHASQVLRGMYHIDVFQLANSIINELENKCIVIDIDKGTAAKNIAERFNDCEFRRNINDWHGSRRLPIIQFNKLRHENGDIGFSNDKNDHWYHDILSTDELLVIDDICDGGKTFIEFGKYISSINEDIKLHLYITHGFFTRGEDTIKSLLHYYSTIRCSFCYNEEVLHGIYSNNWNDVHILTNNVLIPPQLYELVHIHPLHDTTKTNKITEE